MYMDTNTRIMYGYGRRYPDESDKVLCELIIGTGVCLHVNLGYCGPTCQGYNLLQARSYQVHISKVSSWNMKSTTNSIHPFQH